VNGAVVANLDFRTTAQANDQFDRWTDDYGNVFVARGDGWQYIPPEG